MTTTLDRTSSSTGTTVPVQTVTVAEPGTRMRRRVAAGTFFGAAAITMAGILTTPFEGKAGEDVYLRTLAAHPRQAIVAAVLLHFGYLLFVPAAFTMARLARRGARKLSAAGITLAVLGSGLSGLLVTDLYDLSIARHVGPVAGSPVSNMTDVPLAGLGFVTMGALTSFGMILGLVLLAGAMRRARLAPIWPPFALLIGFLSAFGAHDLLRTSVGFGVVCVSIAVLGVKVLRMSDERFAYGSDPR
ncbi:MAG TPA: hypothetical protein VFJ17_04710 [Mycobacteriales bacterium]|jgi:hypothetical protein|nr:hypothetical protein [Mycobacteriales bacterium]